MTSATHLKSVAIVAIIAALPALSSAAPSVHDKEIVIKRGSTSSLASGSIADAIDNDETIGCNYYESNASRTVRCVAIKRSGASLRCSIRNWGLERWIPVAVSANDSSFISFTANSSGLCTSIKVTNGSRYLP